MRISAGPHINLLFTEKVARGMFQPIARHITGNDREERLAEAVAMAFEEFQRAARRGVLLDDALLVHVARLRAIDLGRHLVRGRHSRRDALDARNYHRGRVEVLHLDGLPGDDGHFSNEEDFAVHGDLLDHLARDPTAKLDSAIDMARWLRTLPTRDRAILVARYEGQTLAEIAARLGVTISPVFGRLRRLGTELAARAGVIVARKPRKARAQRSPAPPAFCPV